MKKIIIMVAAIMFGSFAFAQDAPASTLEAPLISPPTPVTIDTVPKFIEVNPPSGNYLCAHCGLRMEEPGKCEKHNFTLVEKGHYYCEEHNGVTSKTAAKCPKCEKVMTLMELKKE